VVSDEGLTFHSLLFTFSFSCIFLRLWFTLRFMTQTSKVKPTIILDCDPGHDDAVAILLAAKHCTILGITTVTGNVSLEYTTHNALLMTQILNLDIPVHVGASHALNQANAHAPEIHGKTGLGGPKLPKLTRKPAGHHAVGFIIDTIRNNKDVWLVPIGPLTNIALAIRQAPDIVKKIKGISLMGGSNSFGNRTPASEFNIYADPEAADIVFSSGADILMCGLNLTHQFLVKTPDITEIRKTPTFVASFVADMLEFFAHAYSKRLGEIEAPLHDPCAILAITHPQLIQFEPRHVVVELRGQHTRGMTLVDERGFRNSDLDKNAQVALKIDHKKALKIVKEAIKSYQ
jgi:inosine-uridine nucleoside N-ribohydrolase